MPKIRKRYCPHCNHTLDAATNLEDENLKPRKDDLTICINCAEILQFDKNIRPVKLKGMTLDTIPQDTMNELLTIRKAIINRGRL